MAMSAAQTAGVGVEAGAVVERRPGLNPVDVASRYLGRRAVGCLGAGIHPVAAVPVEGAGDGRRAEGAHRRAVEEAVDPEVEGGELDGVVGFAGLGQPGSQDGLPGGLGVPRCRP
jgi:hypothetical protein